VNINIDGFTFPIEVVVIDRVQMILGRYFLATSQAIINLDQGEIIIRSGEDYITSKVSEQYRCLRQKGVPKEEVNLEVAKEKEFKEPEGQGLPRTS